MRSGEGQASATGPKSGRTKGRVAREGQGRATARRVVGRTRQRKVKRVREKVADGRPISTRCCSLADSRVASPKVII